MTAPCRSTHWLSTASAGSAFVSPVPSPKRPCRAEVLTNPQTPDPSPTSFPRHLQSSVLGPGPSVASAAPLVAASSICSVPPSGRLKPSSPPHPCLSSFSRYVQEIRAPSSGSSPLLPPPAVAAQSAATPTIYHGDGSLVPSVEVLGDIPKYICQGMHTIYYSLSIVSSLQLQGSRC